MTELAGPGADADADAQAAQNADDGPSMATESSPRPTGGKLALRFVEAVAFGLVLGFCALAIVPVILGWRPYTVLTGSMRPNIDPGDVVMDRPMKISDADVGDVITFSDPGREGALVTHRIRSIEHGPTLTDVETRGDANNNSERWTIRSSDEVGRVVYVIPRVGYAANEIKNHPAGILLLVVLPVILVGAGVVRNIWREDDPDDAGDADEPSDTDDEGGADDEGDADDRPDR